MTDQQIRQIMSALNEQHRKSEEQLNAQYQVWKDFRSEIKIIKEQIADIQKKQEPVTQIFESVTGFNAIAVWILKALIMLGAAMGVIYGFIQYLKK